MLTRHRQTDISVACNGFYLYPMAIFLLCPVFLPPAILYSLLVLHLHLSKRPSISQVLLLSTSYITTHQAYSFYDNLPFISFYPVFVTAFVGLFFIVLHLQCFSFQNNVYFLYCISCIVILVLNIYTQTYILHSHLMLTSLFI